MTTDSGSAIIEFVFAGIAVIGVYLLVMIPVLIIWHKLSGTTAPLPDKKLDTELKRWQKPAPSPYDLSKVGGITRRVK